MMPKPVRRYLPHLSVALLAIAVHARTVWFEFVFDDLHLIVSNKFLREAWSPLLAFVHHFWHGTIAGPGYYRPLVIASLALNGRILGWGPAGFHAVNVLLHAVNAVLLLELARRLTGNDRAAVFAAAFFAVHPVASWPVASIVARVDLLPLLFILLAWTAYAAGGPAPGAPAVPSPAPNGPSAALPPRLSAAWPPWPSAALTGAFFLCALLCKESAVAFLIVPLMGLREAGGRRRWAPLVASGGAVATYVALRAAAGMGLFLRLERIDPIINPVARLPLPGRVDAALALSGRYLLYLLLPWRFSDPRGYSPGEPSPPPFGPWTIGAAIALAGAAVAILLLWRRRDRIAPPLAFALLSFVPASNLLVPIASLYAQNFLYLPLAGLTLAVALLLGRIGPSAVAGEDRRAGGRRPIVWAAAAILALLGGRAALEDGIWKDGVSLFTAWTERFPRYATAHANLGRERLAAGDPAAAMAPLHEALALDDRSFEAHHNLAIALTLTAKDDATLEKALDEEQKALALSPGLAAAFANASRILLRLGRLREAEGAARQALAADPGLASAREYLGNALQKQSRFGEAAGEFEQAVGADPSNERIRAHYVVTLIEQGDLAAAKREALAARQAFPGNAHFDFYLARIAARTDRRGEALDLLRASIAKNPAAREWIANAEDFKPYVGSPEFESIVKPPR